MSSASCSGTAAQSVQSKSSPVIMHSIDSRLGSRALFAAVTAAAAYDALAPPSISSPRAQRREQGIGFKVGMGVRQTDSAPFLRRFCV
eukprot:COSAG06_NODE_772_length_12432_cov_119.880159_16_plen_88_part_00